MRVDKEEFLRFLDYRQKLQAAPVESLEFFDGEERISVDPDLLEEWKVTGLSNWDFSRLIITGSCGVMVMRLDRSAGPDEPEKA